MTLAKRINGWTRRIPAWPIYVIFAGVGTWYFWLAASGAWIDPVAQLEHAIGLLALQVLIAVLAISPLRVWTKISLVKYRRALGVTAFFLVLYHLSVWWLLDVQELGRAVADILKRPYITIGMAAFVMLVPIAATSNDLSIRRLGFEAWKRIHYLTYPAIFLGGVHFVMLRKGWQLEPLIYLGVITVLLLMRVKWRRLAVLPGSRAPQG
jgi:sulfoxide reductase heme-binding subunit YedZ